MLDPVGHLGGRITDDRGDPGASSHRLHAADHLAVEALLVEEALAGDDEIGGGDRVVEVELVGDELEARHELAAECEQRPGQSARRAAAVDLAHVDAVLLGVDLGDAFEPSLEQADLRRRGALLRAERRCRADEPRAHVARDEQLDAAQAVRCVDGPHRAEAAVGRRRPAEADDDLAGSGIEGEVDQLAGAGGRRGHRVVVVADQRQAGRGGHLDHCGATVQPPCSRDGISERSADRRRAVRSAENGERPLPAVRDGNLGAIVAEVPAGVADRSTRLSGGGRAAEFVHRGNHPHGTTLRAPVTYGPAPCPSPTSPRSTPPPRPSWCVTARPAPPNWSLRRSPLPQSRNPAVNAIIHPRYERAMEDAHAGVGERPVRRRAGGDEGPRRPAGRRAVPRRYPGPAAHRPSGDLRLGGVSPAARRRVHRHRSGQHAGVGEHDHHRATGARAVTQSVEPRPLDRRVVGRFGRCGGRGDRPRRPRQRRRRVDPHPRLGVRSRRAEGVARPGVRCAHRWRGLGRLVDERRGHSHRARCRGGARRARRLRAGRQVRRPAAAGPARRRGRRRSGSAAHRLHRLGRHRSRSIRSASPRSRPRPSCSQRSATTCPPTRRTCCPTRRWPQRFVAVIGAHTDADTRELEGMLGRAVTEDDLEPDNLFYGRLGRSVSARRLPRSARPGSTSGPASCCRGGTRSTAAAGFDLLVTPVLAGPPPRIGELVGKQGVHRVRALLQFTAQFNVSGQPAISLPLHWTPDGLPVGVQLVAAYGREDTARARRRAAGGGAAVGRSTPAARHRGRSRRALTGALAVRARQVQTLPCRHESSVTLRRAPANPDLPGSVSAPWPSPFASRPPCAPSPAARPPSRSRAPRWPRCWPTWRPPTPASSERLFDEEGGLRKFVNVFVADDDVRYLDGVDTKVPDGETVSIIPAVAGGYGSGTTKGPRTEVRGPSAQCPLRRRSASEPLRRADASPRPSIRSLPCRRRACRRRHPSPACRQRRPRW